MEQREPGVSSIWAYIFHLLPSRAGNIFISFPFVTRSQPQSPRGVSVYAKTSSVRGVCVSSVVRVRGRSARPAGYAVPAPGTEAGPTVTVSILCINLPKLT